MYPVSAFFIDTISAKGGWAVWGADIGRIQSVTLSPS